MIFHYNVHTLSKLIMLLLLFLGGGGGGLPVPIFPLEFVKPWKDIANAGAWKRRLDELKRKK